MRAAHLTTAGDAIPATEPRRPLRAPDPVFVEDVTIRLVGIPLLGAVIPHLTGLFSAVGPRPWLRLSGYAWFILLSGLVWQGNRFAMVFHRRRYDWFDHPWRKVLLILCVNLLFVTPLCLGMLAAWYKVAGTPIDRNAVKVTTLVVVMVALFIVHVYETVYLLQQREGDLLAVARLEKARVEAELLALKSQIDPHFLFNGLHSLAYLIPREPARAVEFTERLSDVYQYILLNRERDLVPLAEELAFALRYVGLLRIRFGDAVRLRPADDLDPEGLLVPPVSLQVLLENAVKHNRLDESTPLEITIGLEGDGILVKNPRKRPRAAGPSSKVGLGNLDERCRRITGRGVVVRADDEQFAVRVPVVSRAERG
jgi:hypothetical protein